MVPRGSMQSRPNPPHRQRLAPMGRGLDTRTRVCTYVHALAQGRAYAQFNGHEVDSPLNSA